MKPKFRAFVIGTEKLQEVWKMRFYETEGLYINEYYGQDFILMQSTGLHDKNGVEIFEGDIIEHLDFNSNEISKSEVRILKGCFYLVISVDGFKYDVPMMDLKDNECILEIKGNVHENPELLEDV